MNFALVIMFMVVNTQFHTCYITRRESSRCNRETCERATAHCHPRKFAEMSMRRMGVLLASRLSEH